MTQKVELKDYTAGEERFNWITHFAGAALSLVALVISLVFAVLGKNKWSIVSCAVYGISLLLLYTMSTLYHMLPKGRVKRIFRIFDHCSIFLLIAGTYTPYTLVTLRAVTTWIGWTIFGLVWGAAVLGIILNCIDIKKFSKISMLCYISMGWCIVLSINTLITGLDTLGLILLFAGGVMYTVGAIIYGIGAKVRYMHSVWHLFVLAGSIFHFFSILFFVV